MNEIDFLLPYVDAMNVDFSLHSTHLDGIIQFDFSRT